MIINFEQLIRNVDGTPLLEGKTPITLASVAIQALSLGNDKAIQESKGKYFNLAIQIAKGPVLDLEAKDITIIQEAISNFYRAPIIVGQANLMLDGKETGIVAKRSC